MHHASSTTDWCRVQSCKGFPDAILLFCILYFAFCVFLFIFWILFSYAFCIWQKITEYICAKDFLMQSTSGHQPATHCIHIYDMYSNQLRNELCISDLLAFVFLKYLLSCILYLWIWVCARESQFKQFLYTGIQLLNFKGSRWGRFYS